MCLGTKGHTDFDLGESVVLMFFESLKDTNCYVYFDNFSTCPRLMTQLLESAIYVKKSDTKP